MANSMGITNVQITVSKQKPYGRSKGVIKDDSFNQQSNISKYDEMSVHSNRSIPDKIGYSSNSCAEIKKTSSQKKFDIELKISAESIQVGATD